MGVWTVKRSSSPPTHWWQKASSQEADVSRSSSPAEVQFAAVDFSLLQRSTLDRLAGHYAVELPPDASDRSVAGLVGREFSRQHVDESEALDAFLCVHGITRTPAARHVSSTRQTKKLGQRVSSSTGIRKKGIIRTSSGSRKRSREITYGEMIAKALLQLPSQQGTLDEIYAHIEQHYAGHLNYDLESGPRRIPVWKASVRKIINLNASRFRRLPTEREGQILFRLA